MFESSKYLGVDNILPSGRGGASSVLKNNKLFIFGGMITVKTKLEKLSYLLKINCLCG